MVIQIPTAESEEGYLKKSAESKKKVRISIAIDRDFIVWIDGMIEKGIFANRSHAIHRALLKLKQEVVH